MSALSKSIMAILDSPQRRLRVVKIIAIIADDVMRRGRGSASDSWHTLRWYCHNALKTSE